MRSLSFLSLGLLACKVLAQGGATFTGMAWTNATVGDVWPIHWTIGDGTPVSLFLGNTTWNVPIFSELRNSPA